MPPKLKDYGEKYEYVYLDRYVLRYDNSTVYHRNIKLNRADSVRCFLEVSRGGKQADRAS